MTPGLDERPIRTCRRRNIGPVVVKDATVVVTVVVKRPKNRASKTAFRLVELIGRNSNLGHLRKNWIELRKRIRESPPRPASVGAPPRSKRHLGVIDVDDIVLRYESGQTTQQIGAYFGISKSRVASVLREQA